MSEMKYCIWCGKSYTGRAEKCPYCGKNPDPVENRLADWLYSHTKDKLKGDIEGNIYEKIKNWLLSHLYGIVLSVTLVATVASAAGGGTAHIKQVDRFPGEDITVNENQVIPDEPEEKEILSLSDRLDITVGSYLEAVNNSGGVMTDEIKRLMVPESLGLNGHFEAFTDRWTNNKEDTSAVISSYATRNHSTMYVEPSRVYLALQNMGYTPYYATGYNALYFTDVPEGGADIVFQYLCTVVEIDGNWYIAEALEYNYDRYIFDSELREGEYVYTSPDMM